MDSQTNEKDDTEDSDAVHKCKFRHALSDIQAHNGRKVRVTLPKDAILWTVLDDHLILQKMATRSNNRLGIKELVVQKCIEDSPLPLTELFLLLTFKGGEWERSLDSMNKEIDDNNSKFERNNTNTNKNTKPLGLVKQFPKKEFICALGLLIGAADCSDESEAL